MNEALSDKVKALPRSPGVYLMKDLRGKVVYVGKARTLRARVSSYFAASRTPHPRTDALVAKIADVDFIVTDSELDALILEQSLIKEYRPRYNVNLKDDKRFPYLRITRAHAYPGVEITRQLGDAKSRYFGPYTDVASLRHTVKRLRRAFPLRVCSDHRVDQSDRRECLDFFIGSCVAPCTRRVTPEQYGAIVESFTRFLSGQGEAVLSELETEMNAASEARQYERAAVFRDRLQAAASVLRKQQIESPRGEDVDVLGLAAGDDDALGLVLRVRDGRLIGKEERLIERTTGLGTREVLGQFLMQFYLADRALPSRVALPQKPADPELLGGWLERRRGGPVDVFVPTRGFYARLSRIAMRNAVLAREERRARDGASERLGPELYALKESLGLEAPPQRIEGVDVSTIQGTDQVASVVVFLAGEPARALYRRYRIKGVQGTDDFASIQEVVDRRVSRALAEGQALPDLLLIDGGEGQVSAARKALEKYDLRGLPMIGLAKREETIVFADARPPLQLGRRSEALKLLQRVRNEAHRFAVSYHRGLRSKRLRASALDGIEGIGPQKKARLLRAFGSVRALRLAKEEDVAALPGIGLATARKILAALAGSERE